MISTLKIPHIGGYLIEKKEKGKACRWMQAATTKGLEFHSLVEEIKALMEKKEAEEERRKALEVFMGRTSRTCIKERIEATQKISRYAVQDDAEKAAKETIKTNRQSYEIPKWDYEVFTNTIRYRKGTIHCHELPPVK